MDGKVLTEIFHDAYVSGNPPRQADPGAESGPRGSGALKTEDEKKIEERLRGLGYIE